MEKSKQVKFRTPSSKSSRSSKSDSLNDSFNTTRQKFLNAPQPLQDDEEVARQREKLREMNRQKEKEKKRKKKKKNKQKELVLDDEDLDGRRIQELQEAVLWSENKQEAFDKFKTLMLRHMRALDDLTRLRNHYYHEYKNALDAKVIQQRKDIKKKTEELQRKIELKKLKEMEASHHVKKRLTKSVANVDNTFLKNLPKSKMYKIMTLQSKMMTEGRFTCIEDVETFWANVNDPDILYGMLEKGADDSGAMPEDDDDDDDDDAKSQQSDDSADGNESSIVGSLVPQERLDVNPSLFSIDEDNEPTRPGTKRNSLNGQGSSVGTQQSIKQTKNYYKKPVHPKVAEMEQKYPRVDFPDMQALYMDLDPPKEDPEIVALKDDFKQRSKIRRDEKKRLKRMYALSRSNEASTQRLMDKNQDFSDVMDSLYISDVGSMLTKALEPDEPDQLQLANTPYNYPSFNPALPLPPAILHRSNSLTPAMQEISRLLDYTIPEEREEDILSRGSILSGKKRKSQKLIQEFERDSVSSRGSSASSLGSRRR